MILMTQCKTAVSQCVGNGDTAVLHQAIYIKFQTYIRLWIHKKTPHNLPSQVNYGMDLVGILEKMFIL